MDATDVFLPVQAGKAPAPASGNKAGREAGASEAGADEFANLVDPGDADVDGGAGAERALDKQARAEGEAVQAEADAPSGDGMVAAPGVKPERAPPVPGGGVPQVSLDQTAGADAAGAESVDESMTDEMPAVETGGDRRPVLPQGTSQTAVVDGGAPAAEAAPAKTGPAPVANTDAAVKPDGARAEAAVAVAAASPLVANARKADGIQAQGEPAPVSPAGAAREAPKAVQAAGGAHAPMTPAEAPTGERPLTGVPEAADAGAEEIVRVQQERPATAAPAARAEALPGTAAVPQAAEPVAAPSAQPVLEALFTGGDAPPEARAEPETAQTSPRVFSAAPVQVRPGEVINQIAVAVRSAKDSEIEIRLDPPELGRLSIRIETLETGVRAIVMAERAETQDLLRRQSEMLERELDAAGFEGADVEFASSEGFTRDADEDGFAADDAPEPVFVSAPTLARDLPQAPGHRTSNSLDIRL